MSQGALPFQYAERPEFPGGDRSSEACRKLSSLAGNCARNNFAMNLDLSG